MMTKDGILSPEALIRACVGEEDVESEIQEPELQEILHRCGLQADIACAFKAANLTEREEGVLYARYVMGLDLIQTGHLYGVTRERIRQIEAKALRKVHGRKAAMRILKCGMEAYVEDRLEEYRERERERYDREIECFKQFWIEDHPNGHLETPNEEEARQMRDARMARPIEELDLSVRAYNCLKRRGLNTVGEVIDFVQQGPPEWYRRVRNLGVKSADEVARKVFQVTGIQINTWETGAIIDGGCIDDQAGST